MGRQDFDPVFRPLFHLLYVLRHVALIGLVLGLILALVAVGLLAVAAVAGLVKYRLARARRRGKSGGNVVVGEKLSLSVRLVFENGSCTRTCSFYKFTNKNEIRGFIVSFPDAILINYQ